MGDYDNKNDNLYDDNMLPDYSRRDGVILS